MVGVSGGTCINYGVYYSPTADVTSGTETTTTYGVRYIRNDCHINLIRCDYTATEEELDKLLAKQKNDFDSRWIMREGKRLNIKPQVYPFIARQFIRKMIPCNRRGVGLHTRKRMN